MGIIEEQLSKKKDYRKRLENLANSNPPFKVRLSLVFLYYADKLSGEKHNINSYSLFLYVVDNIRKLLELIGETNPRYVSLQKVNERAIIDHLPNWSVSELFNVLKGLKYTDGREIVARIASNTGMPYILDSYDSNDVDGFAKEFKHIESDTIKSLMSITNILYKADTFKGALVESDEEMDSFLENGEESIVITDYETVHKDVMLPLLEQSGLLLFLVSNPIADINRNFGQYQRDFHVGGELIPMEKVVATLEYYLREYYYNINILLPEEKEAIEKVLSKEKYKEQVAPIVEKCLLEHEHQGMATATTHKTLDHGSAKYSEKLKSEEAQKMFERFIDEGYIVQREDGFYNWQKTQALCVYFAESASEHLGLDSLKAGKKHSSWKPFENVFFFVDAGTNEWTKQHHNFSSIIQNQPKPEGAETIDEIFKTLK